MPEPTPIAELLGALARDNPSLPPALSPDDAARCAADLESGYWRSRVVDALRDVAHVAQLHAEAAGAAGPHNLHCADRLALMLDALYHHVTGRILTPDERRRIGLT